MNTLKPQNTPLEPSALLPHPPIPKHLHTPLIAKKYKTKVSVCVCMCVCVCVCVCVLQDQRLTDPTSIIINWVRKEGTEEFQAVSKKNKWFKTLKAMCPQCPPRSPRPAQLLSMCTTNILEVCLKWILRYCELKLMSSSVMAFHNSCEFYCIIHLSTAAFL